MIRFKHYMSEGKKVDDLCQDVLKGNLNAFEDEELIKKLMDCGATRSSAIKKLQKRFDGRFGLKEEDMGQSLGPAEAKAINVELFNAMKDTKSSSDLKALFDPIRQIMADHGIEMTIGNRLITSKGQKEFSCEPYTNIKLVVSWSESKGEFLLKDATLQGIK